MADAGQFAMLNAYATPEARAAGVSSGALTPDLAASLEQQQAALTSPSLGTRFGQAIPGLIDTAKDVYNSAPVQIATDALNPVGVAGRAALGAAKAGVDFAGDAFRAARGKPSMAEEAAQASAAPGVVQASGAALSPAPQLAQPAMAYVARPASGGGGGGFGGFASELKSSGAAQQAAYRAEGASLQENARAQADAVTAQADAAVAKAGQLAESHRAGIMAADQMQADQATHQQLQAHAIDEQRQKLGTAQEAAARMFEDPGKFWADKSTGGKIAAGIAIAFGALGAGLQGGGPNQALGIIQKQIDQDIEAQRNNIGKSYKDLDLQQRQLRDMRDQLGDDRQWGNVLQQQHWQSVARQMDQVNIDNMAPEMRAQAMKSRADVQAKLDESQSRINQTAAAAVSQNVQQRFGVAQARAQNALGYAGLEAQREAHQLAAGARGGKAERLPTSETTKLADIQTAQGMIGDLRDKPNRAVAALTRFLPGNYDADNYNRQAKTLGQVVGTALEGGKLTDADFENKYLPLVPQSGDSDSVAHQKLSNLDKLLARKGKSLSDIFSQQGFAIPQTEQSRTDLGGL